MQNPSQRLEEALLAQLDAFSQLSRAAAVAEEVQETKGVQQSLPMVPTERLLNATRSLLLCIQGAREQLVLKGSHNRSGPDSTGSIDKAAAPATISCARLTSQVSTELTEMLQELESREQGQPHSQQRFEDEAAKPSVLMQLYGMASQMQQM